MLAAKRCIAVMCLCAVLGMYRKPAITATRDVARKEAALADAERALADATSVLRVSCDATEMAVARARAASGVPWIADLSRVPESACTSAREVAGKVGAKERLGAI
jgi:hypothetical protein